MPRFIIALTAIVASLVIPATASAVTVTKSQLSGGQLRIEGTGAALNQYVIAESSTSAAGVRADLKGNFKIQATGFTSPNCWITVRDGSTPTATVLIPGCTPTVLPVTAPPAPTGTCRLVPPAGTVSFTRNVSSTLYFTTTGCATTGFGDLKFSVTGGSIPVGMTGPQLQGPDAANIIGTPTLAGTYTFQIKVTDRLGQSDWENYTIRVA